MAELNLDYYSGEDRYSDGDVEERILRDVRRARENGPFTAGAAGRVIAEAYERENPEDAFAYLYHLSPVRENILSWYPFRKDGCALEIGAGPGAVTGILCRKLKRVTAVDLSRRRCMINYERHRELDNLNIMVGNLNEMKFPGLFDYVILNGVFEYAESFTEGDHPYETFLSRCAGFLRKDGIMLVAIENRLGLKYFSGAPEDHTGNYMEGLKNYPRHSGVRTFSRAEWRELAGRCGLRVRRFDYPYPDYKFPAEVCTDGALSADAFDRCSWNFSPARLQLFPEREMARAFQKDGVLGCFMNSFLVELERGNGKETEHAEDGSERSRVLYAKMNADRNPEYQIQTLIRENAAGEREAVKQPLCPEAESHIRRMGRLSGRERYGTICLGGKPYEVRSLPGRFEGTSVIYPFLPGRSLGSEAAEAADAGDAETVTAMTDALWELILQRSSHDAEPQATKTPAAEGSAAGPEGPDGTRGGSAPERFCDVFGPASLPDPGPMVCPANIDLIFDNLIRSEDGIRVIDEEWVFDFPVPARFVLWRAVNELYSGHMSLEKALPRQRLLSRYQISPRDAEVFWQWADFFEKRYVGANRLAGFTKPVRRVDLKDLHTFEGNVQLDATLYLDRGQGFSEKDAVRCSVSMDGERYEAVFTVPCPETVRALRFDPLEGSCCVCALSSPEGRLRPVNAAVTGGGTALRAARRILGARDRKEETDTGIRPEACEFLTADPSYRLLTGRCVPEKVHVRGVVRLESEQQALEHAGRLLGKYRRIFRL